MDKLAVVVEGIDDEQLVSRLLSGRNYRRLHQCESLYNASEKFNSIIICHRRSQQAPAPRLPDSLSNARIIVLSDRTDENFIVDSLIAGAHYFFDLRDTERVLAARLHAALRRHSQQDNHILHVEPYLFKVDSRTAFCEDRVIDLSPREFELAYYLFSNRDRIVSDSELMTGVWTLPPSLDTRRIDTSICRIKKKMKLNTDQSTWEIVRLRKEGYQVRRLSPS